MSFLRLLLLCTSDSLGYAFVLSLCVLCVLGGSILFAFPAVASPMPAVQLQQRTISPQRQIAHSFPPFLYNNGGASLTSRRPFSHTWRRFSRLPPANPAATFAI